MARARKRALPIPYVTPSAFSRPTSWRSAWLSWPALSLDLGTFSANIAGQEVLSAVVRIYVAVWVGVVAWLGALRRWISPWGPGTLQCFGVDFGFEMLCNGVGMLCAGSGWA